MSKQPSKESDTEMMAVRLPKSLARKLRAVVRAGDTDVSKFVREAVREHVTRKAGLLNIAL